MTRGPRIMRLYRQTRAAGYRVVRTMGNAQPWLDLACGDPHGPQKIVRRMIHRKLGTWFSGQLFGRGWIAHAIKALLGL